MDERRTINPTENNNEKQRGLKHWEKIAVYLVLYDIAAVNFAYFFALLVRFDLKYTSIPAAYLQSFLRFAPFYTAFCIIVFFIMRLYNSMWRFASLSELNRIFVSTILTTAFQAVGITAVFMRMPYSYYIMGCFVQFLLITGVRFAYRYINMERSRRENNSGAVNNAMVIGAGNSGQAVIKELKNSDRIKIRPCCVIDDNPNKWNRYIEGVPVVGDRNMIPAAVEKYNIDQILFAIPTASAKERKEILDICKDTKCELKSLPGVFQLVNGQVSLSQMRDVKFEELLGREPVKVNMDEIFRFIMGKVIIVTGGGGSIGSELCRQIAEHGPKQLIIFDIYENNAYDIEQELRRKYPNLNLVVLIGSVRDSRRINSVFEAYKPDVVYHAAAHKHVPLMENSPNEAIKNNVIGTYKTAYAALRNGVQRFVLISTDKAVNPTNIMGASKRLCEMVIQCMDAVSKAGLVDRLPVIAEHMDLEEGIVQNGGQDNAMKWEDALKIESVENNNRTGTQFVAVRFGNVLGSNGSVIPLFKKQIAEGGPVTVTHPDIVRYFMTIPEAVSLVLQAGVYAWGGEIFVLDMGEPVKIDALARNLIRLSGHVPDEDIKVVYSGLRPGEKLYEEKLMAEEGLKKTDNDLIFIGKPVPFDVEKFIKQLHILAEASFYNSDEIVRLVREAVPTYRSGN
ncbi:MAG TPA: polysaccharide biosynthesis protein [Candidatus Alectryocaccobium stercorigallinarum]|nr:polysaccharide biosynthesis protein [Candidatus Alectryocaccobium stercorigallinarum]